MRIIYLFIIVLSHPTGPGHRDKWNTEKSYLYIPFFRY